LTGDVTDRLGQTVHKNLPFTFSSPFDPLEAEVYPGNVYKFSSSLTENTLTQTRRLMLVREIAGCVIVLLLCMYVVIAAEQSHFFAHLCRDERKIRASDWKII
jgi:hypothetical protein